MTDTLSNHDHHPDHQPDHDVAGALSRWSVADIHPSMTSRSFVDAMEQTDADVTRLIALFEDRGIRAVEPRTPTAEDVAATEDAINGYNATEDALNHLEAYVYATVSTDTRDEQAGALLNQIEERSAKLRPLLARFAEWTNSLLPEALAERSELARDHVGPMLRLAERAAHQMNEHEEGLYAELTNTGSSAWDRLHRDLASQLTTEVELPTGTVRLPMAAVRGLAMDADPRVRLAALASERRAWPEIATGAAAAMNAIKGEANVVGRRRHWDSPLDASLYANSVSRATFDAMQSAIDAALPRLRSWMRMKAKLHGTDGPLVWSDLFAPLPISPGGITWEQGVGLVRDAFASYSAPLADVVDRAVREQWLDVEPRDGKVGGAFCMPFVDDRSLVLLNWNGSFDSAQVTAHELGHAYHNTQLAQRTPLQRRVPMALAETASIFCETLVVEAGLVDATGAERLALLDGDLRGSLQVVVDIRSRFLFEQELFARRAHRTLGVSELNELMLESQAAAYGDGLDQSTALSSMWIVKPHYYSSHFYNWPYTYGLLFGVGLFAQYGEDPERFQSGYDDVLSRAGMNTAEELGASFGLDVTGEAFWTASLDIVSDRITQYEALARAVAPG